MRVPPDPLKPYQWNRRVLVVSAPSVIDANYRAQQAALAKDPDGQADRELTVIGIVDQAADTGLDATSLRERLSLPPDRFEVVLVGKDGGVALRQPQAVTLDELFARIDAMPMRRADLRRRDEQP